MIESLKMYKLLMAACAVMLTSCGDVFFADPAAPEGAMAISYSISASDGAVFDKANRVNVFVSLAHTSAPGSDPAVLSIDTTVSMAPASETRIRLPINAPEGTYSGIAGIAVLRDSDTLFTKFQEVTMQIAEGEANRLVFDALRPYVTEVEMPATVRTLTGPGDTVTIVATPRYATGDVVTGATCSYFVADHTSNVVTVNSTTGRVVAVGSGTKTISYVCQFAPGVGSVTVTVAGPPAGTASLSGTVVNATTSNPISGATVSIVPQQGGQTRQVVTNTSGSYSFTNLATGIHSITVSAPNFSTVSGTVNLLGGSQTRIFALSPPAATGSWRMVLTWGATPEDLDSHLFISGTAQGPHHIDFSNRGSSTSFPFATLDTDETDGFGPETITIVNVEPGALYRYSVNLFFGSTGTFSTSLARVDLYNGSTQVGTFTPPSNGTGEWWHVFSMVNNTITPINTINDTEPSFNLGTAHQKVLVPMTKRRKD